MAKRRKKTLPSNKRIIEIDKEVSNSIEEVLKEEAELSESNSIQYKLGLMRNTLLALKKKKATFKTINSIIKRKFGLDINDQTLRKYCQKVLDFEKKQKRRVNKTSKKEEIENNKVEENSEEQKPSDGLKRKL